MAENAKNPKPYRCGICQKNFRRNFHLKRHIGTHSINRPFRCPLCLASFARRDVLNRHVDAHARHDEVDIDAENLGTQTTTVQVDAQVLPDDPRRESPMSYQLQSGRASNLRQSIDSSTRVSLGLRRARVTVACDACTILKLKCDDGVPCKACLRGDIDCSFERKLKIQGRHRAGAVSESYMTSHWLTESLHIHPHSN